MSSKKADLEKHKAMQIENQRRESGNHFGPASAPVEDRRARRERERALGLVPLAVKLPADLLREIQSRAQTQGTSIDQSVEHLLRAGMAAQAN